MSESSCRMKRIEAAHSTRQIKRAEAAALSAKKDIAEPGLREDQKKHLAPSEGEGRRGKCSGCKGRAARDEKGKGGDCQRDWKAFQKRGDWRKGKGAWGKFF